MVLGDISTIDVPPLRGNPFDSRPVERTRAHEIVGREEILIKWKEHMHSQSPRMFLLVGERGSGRTSLINAISSQTNQQFVGYYWHKEDPLHRVLNEIAVSFCGHDVPSTMHQKVERIVETLDLLNGPIPLIAFDYPSEVEISSFLSMILPILQRLRALVVVSLSDSQILSLEDSVKEAFDETVNIEPLTSSQIQSLCDIRIRRMAREKWKIGPDLLEAIISRTGGNARSVVSVLRDLIDEKRGLGSHGALEALTKWPVSETRIIEDSDTTFEEPGEISEETARNGPLTKLEGEHETNNEQDYEEEKQGEGPESEDDDWDTEPEDMWEEEEVIADPIHSTGEEPIDPRRITDWTQEGGTILSVEEGTIPPIGKSSTSGFSGLVSRSRLSIDEMPTGPDYSTPIQEPETVPQREKPELRATENSDNKGKTVRTNQSTQEEKRVFHSEGELWTVDSDLEETLPDPSEPISEDFTEELETSNPESMPVNQEKQPFESNLSIPAPTWESPQATDRGHLSSLSKAERLIVSIAGVREISPSDPEIQARLEVGRPRLSQIYNSLHKSGILSVRKEGRSRMFKLSEGASEFLQEG